MIGHKDISVRNGGVEVVVERLSEGLVNKGYLVTAYNRTDFKTKKVSIFHGIKMKYAPTLRIKGLAAMSSSFFATIQALLDKNDVFHFHAEGPAAMAWIPKFFKKRVIVTIHGLDHRRGKWGKLACWYIKLGERIAVKNADEIIVLSRGLQSYFKETYNRKTKLIPNGIDVVHKKKVDKIKKWGLDKNSYILYLGRIVPEKGVKELVISYNKIKTKKKLVIAGGSSDSNKYLEEVKNISKDNDNIIFTDFVVGGVLAELFSNAYIYVLPSKLEGMPMSLLEAMAYGNCCLVSDIPESIDVIKENGVSFKLSYTYDLSEKLEYLCNNIEIVDKYKKKSSNYIYKEYSWMYVIKKVSEVYEMSDNL